MAVVALGPPADLTEPVWSAVVERQYLRPFLGARFAEDPALYVRASPGTYATRDDPPFLLIHSAGDALVPVAQSRAFATKLKQAGVSVELIEEDGVQHVWGGERLDRTMEQVATFLDRPPELIISNFTVTEIGAADLWPLLVSSDQCIGIADTGQWKQRRRL